MLNPSLGTITHGLSSSALQPTELAAQSCYIDRHFVNKFSQRSMRQLFRSPAERVVTAAAAMDIKLDAETTLDSLLYSNKMMATVLLGLAQMQVQESPVIALDEVLDDAAAVSRRRMRYGLSMLCSSMNATVLVVTHSAHFLSDIVDDILFLEEGCTLQYGQIDDLLPFIQTLIR
jgi:ABC-type thiamine transport system ATPase subunit